jgi:hypothetical protein
VNSQYQRYIGTVIASFLSEGNDDQDPIFPLGKNSIAVAKISITTRNDNGRGKVINHLDES